MKDMILAVLLLASAVSAEGRIPVAIISGNGRAGYSSCLEGSDCWYDTHMTGSQSLFRNLAYLGLLGGLFCLVGYAAYSGLKAFVNHGGRSGGLIHP